MRIAVFSDTFVPQVNGVALTLKRWTDYLSIHGVDCKLFVPTEPEPVYEDPVCRLTSIPFWAYPEHRFVIPNLLRIRKELSQFKPDIVHIATPFNVGLAGMYAAQKLHIPIVASYHTHFDQYLESYWFPFAHSWYWSYMKWFHRNCRAIFAPSQETIHLLQSKGLSDLELWSRGVDCDRFTPAKRSNRVRELYGIKERYLLLFVGRLAPEKDLDVLLQLMHRLPDRIRGQVHWLVVGDGPMMEQGLREAPQNVTFTGYRDGEELAEWYASSDLFVFPSATETFGNVVLEAAASGLPAVVADRGGVTEIVQHGKTGLHAQAGNVESFLAALDDWFDEPDKWQLFRTEARELAQSRTWDKAMESIYAHCRQIVKAEQNPEEAGRGHIQGEGESA
ncbi:glycosyltransferase family 4 protein [Paenibacillus harenae]|uniref:Glycosyltransferase involved in cell wall biosynthesis n=1 Tax=Paenibacillus harenae TaxID=306543 RepID=A0ABT9U0Y0_PAEHA|nr:glycosyltransferase family 1 protein [Paenibacillus harenae]MDQ0113271.1 glycosyltransferase involved in cell wall biosynthesis [Paenibacillus harenae]